MSRRSTNGGLNPLSVPVPSNKAPGKIESKSVARGTKDWAVIELTRRLMGVFRKLSIFGDLTISVIMIWVKERNKLT